MLGNDQMRIAAQCMAAIFGGPGIFYIYLSFYRPDHAVTGLIYLAIATALAWVADAKPEARPARRGALAWCKSVIQSKRRP
jgi:hypothetical protein